MVFTASVFQPLTAFKVNTDLTTNADPDRLALVTNNAAGKLNLMQGSTRQPRPSKMTMRCFKSDSFGQ